MHIWAFCRLSGSKTFQCGGLYSVNAMCVKHNYKGRVWKESPSSENSHRAGRIPKVWVHRCLTQAPGLRDSKLRVGIYTARTSTVIKAGQIGQLQYTQDLLLQICLGPKLDYGFPLRSIRWSLKSLCLPKETGLARCFHM